MAGSNLRAVFRHHVYEVEEFCALLRACAHRANTLSIGRFASSNLTHAQIVQENVANACERVL